jgi:hypothetical protein
VREGFAEMDKLKMTGRRQNEKGKEKVASKPFAWICF